MRVSSAAAVPFLVAAVSGQWWWPNYQPQGDDHPSTVESPAKDGEWPQAGPHHPHGPWPTTTSSIDTTCTLGRTATPQTYASSTISTSSSSVKTIVSSASFSSSTSSCTGTKSSTSKSSTSSLSSSISSSTSISSSSSSSCTKSTSKASPASSSIKSSTFASSSKSSSSSSASVSESSSTESSTIKSSVSSTKSSVSTGKSSVSTGKSSVSTGKSAVSTTKSSVSTAKSSTSISKSSTSASKSSTSISKSSASTAKSSASKVSSSFSTSIRSSTSSRSSSRVSSSALPKTSSSSSSTTSSKPTPTATCDYWLENVKHQGIAAFNANPSTYQVFRNVKDYGAKGDGVTDDAAAINLAISSGNRCAPGSCSSSSVSPALVYFPPGTYMINSTIIDYYYTQLVGNPNCLPTIRAFSTFTDAPGSIGLIDGDPYGANGLKFGATNVFWRQLRNFILDTTLIPASVGATGVHWPTGQATSIQNVVFEMNSQKGTQHQGIFIEQGSGGFMSDLVFRGGLYGGNWANQQFTMRNLSFSGVTTAINQLFDWGWTYQNIKIDNCTVGFNISSGGSGAINVGSITLLDSQISNTKIGVLTARGPNSQPPAAGSLIIENVALSNVGVAIQRLDGSVVLPSTPHITAYGAGHTYTPTGPNTVDGAITPVNRPAGLITNGQYYQKTRPQYDDLPASQFISARAQGATGNGKTDDTAALQKAINLAVSSKKVLFLDHGDYLVTSTVKIPAGARIIGESYPVILSSGSFFNDINTPKPVVQIGQPGEVGTIEWTDSIVSTQGQQQGAILFEYNLASPVTNPSGLWDVHARVGGFAGSNLQLANCPTTPNVAVTAANLVEECIAAYLTFHITTSGSGLYLENVWLWVADHDVEDPSLRQITVYAGRGLLDQSTNGNVWLIGTAVEHHVLYEYQFANTRDVFMGQIQTETAYYQPNPSAPLPFPYNAALNDPQFPQSTVTTSDGAVVPAADGWGLRIVNSQSIAAYGVGLYSFFNNYSTSCSAQGNGEVCQDSIASVENSRDITIYNLNTVGTHYPLSLDGQYQIYYADNLDGFVDTVALFRTAA